MTLAGPLTKFVSKFTKMQANAVLKAEVEAILARFEVPSRLLDPMVQRAMVLLHPVVEEEKEETLEEGDGEQGQCRVVHNYIYTVLQYHVIILKPYLYVYLWSHVQETIAPVHTYK